MFRILAFDRKGGRWKRGEHLLTDAGERVRAEHLLRERMIMGPDRFTTPLKIDGTQVSVDWESAVRGVAMAYLRAGEEPAVACLLLAGMDELAEETTARALEERLGVAPGHPLSPAFATVRRERRRPLAVAFRIGDTIDGKTEQALVTLESALSHAYFGLSDLGRAAEADPGPRVTPV